jgi:hypothetical protein
MSKVVEMALGVFECNYTMMHNDGNNNSSMTKKNPVAQTPK